jgi:hypothetical protein
MDKNFKTGVPGNVFKLTVNGLVVEKSFSSSLATH